MKEDWSILLSRKKVEGNNRARGYDKFEASLVQHILGTQLDLKQSPPRKVLEIYRQTPCFHQSTESGASRPLQKPKALPHLPSSLPHQSDTVGKMNAQSAR